jgi:hypothetical protein
MACVFAVQTKFLLHTGVSRYKVSKRLKLSPRIVILLTAVARSGFITGYKSVLGAELIAKTVTNKLPLLSVLCLGIYFIVIM